MFSSENLQKSKKARFKDTVTRTKLGWLSKIDYLQPEFLAGNQTGEVVIGQYFSVICNF